MKGKNRKDLLANQVDLFDSFELRSPRIDFFSSTISFHSFPNAALLMHTGGAERKRERDSPIFALFAFLCVAPVAHIDTFVYKRLCYR